MKANNNATATTQIRKIEIKNRNNKEVFETLKQTINNGAELMFITPRVDAVGCGYVWFGIRKTANQIQLNGKLLINAQIMEYLMAFLNGSTLPEVSNFESQSEVCCQSEWLNKIEAKVSLECLRSKEELSNGYLCKKFIFPQGRIIMPSTQVEDITSLFI